MNQRNRLQSLYSTIVLIAVAVSLASGVLAQPGADKLATTVPGTEKECRALEAKAMATLKSDATLIDKMQACRDLQFVGTPKAIAVLAPLLRDKDLGHWARNALAAMPYTEVDGALRGALKLSSGPQKVGVIGSLGYRRDKKAVKPLIVLMEAEDEAVAMAAVAALGRIGTPEAAQSVVAKAGKSSGAMLDVAVEASLCAANRLIGQGKGADAAAIYESLQSTEWPNAVRAGAFAGLLDAQPDKATDRIIAAIAGDDALMRGTAISKASTMEAGDIVARLAAELPKASPGVQILLIDVMADSGSAQGRRAIEKAVMGVDAGVRVAALKSIGLVGDATNIDLLCGVVTKDSSSPEAAAALASLTVLEGKGVDSALTKQMSKAPPEARAELIAVLGERDVEAAVRSLVKETEADAAVVRIAAFRALGRIATDRDLSRLVKALVDLEGDDGREQAERAVGQVARLVEDDAKRMDPILSSLRKAKSAEAKRSLLIVAGGLGGADAFAAVSASLKDPNAETQDAAVRALSNWPDAMALDTLLDLVRTTDNPVHTVLAIRGSVSALTKGKASKAKALAAYGELMKAAQRPEEKRLVLSGLATVSGVEALNLAKSQIKDASVQTEAELATLAIAQSIVAGNSALARSTAIEIRGSTKSDEAKKQAARLVRQVDQFKDFIVSWHVAGPYSEKGRRGNQLFAVAFPPEKGAKDVKWQALPAKAQNAARPGMINLTATLGGDHRVAYLRTFIESSKAQPARIELGADDGVKVWLNGKVVHGNNSSGAAVAGEEKVDVELKQGWNELLVKVIQHTSKWEACARVCARNGAMLNVKVDANHSGQAAATPKAPAAKAKAKRQGKGKAKAKAPAKPTPVPTPGKPVAAEPVGDWIQIFNGRNLDGWNETGDAEFSVKDGMLVGTQTTGKGGDLWTKAEYDNFELRVTYRVQWPANTGFWYRSNAGKGYQYDVLKYEKPVAFSGTLYCPGKMFIFANLKEEIEKRDDWNEARVRAAGDELTHWLNGVQAGHAWDTTLEKGTIGIQVHPGEKHKGMVVEIKKMEVRKLRLK